ncbi:MAG: CRISPR system precrRNA processing endoribonuclease RAMP protein Cas6 [Thermoflexales bacterium]|nr:CRISPR system precrRNA processing endoribonuclease RAMP protein Cas6 [Thermoflexales bacterium]
MFTACQLRFELQATEPIHLHIFNGSALRGMIYRAALDLAGVPARQPEPLAFAGDPLLARLLQTLDERNLRGQDLPRPYVIDPPPALDEDQRRLLPGQALIFGLTLFGDLVEAFPILVLALRRAESRGLGRFLAREDGAATQPAQRGRFRLARITAHNPYTRADQLLYQHGERDVKSPTVVITPEDIANQATLDARAVGSRLRLRFYTPTTLKAQGNRLIQPVFSALIHRLIERLEQLSQAYGQRLACLPADRSARNALLAQADAVQLVADHTHWVELRGRSDRTRASTNLSGFIGSAEFAADDFAPFLELLRWGEIVHVGQNAVKGNGVFRLAHPQ